MKKYLTLDEAIEQINAVINPTQEYDRKVIKDRLNQATQIEQVKPER